MPKSKKGKDKGDNTEYCKEALKKEAKTEDSQSVGSGDEGEAEVDSHHKGDGSEEEFTMFSAEQVGEKDKELKEPSEHEEEEVEPEETYGLPLEKVEEARKAYSLFQNEKNLVDPRHIPMLIRAVGRNPTEAQIADILGSMGEEPVSFSAVLKVLSELKDLIKLTEIKNALSLFDKERSGKIGMGELMHSLATLGDKLMTDEMEAMVNAADPDEENKTVILDFLKILQET